MKKAALAVLAALVLGCVLMVSAVYVSGAMDVRRISLEAVQISRSDGHLATVASYDEAAGAAWHDDYRGSEGLYREFCEDSEGFACVMVTVTAATGAEEIWHYTDVHVEGAEAFVDWGWFISPTGKIMSGGVDRRVLPVILRAEDLPADLTLTFSVGRLPIWDYEAGAATVHAE